MREEGLQVGADLGRRRLELRVQRRGDVLDRRPPVQPVPDEAGHLVQGVEGFQIADLLAQGDEDRLSGDPPSDELLGVLQALARGQGHDRAR